MKKFAKLSLVAAVAVAGLSTTSSAASLEEAIKGVDISGQVRYRMEDKNVKNGTDTQEDQDVNIDVMVKVPVTDNVTFVANANWDDDNQEDAVTLVGVKSSNNPAGNDVKATNGTATDTSAVLDQYYFQYQNGAVTALLGTHTIAGRLTDAEQGSGLTVLYNAGVATVGAAAMYNSDVSSEAIYTAIAYGNVGPVSLLGQYVDVDNTLDAYNLKADAKVGPVSVGVEYSEKDEDANNDEFSTFKAYISGKAGIFSGSVAYAATGDNGSGSIDEAAETPAELLLWQVGSAGVADLSAYVVDATVAINEKLSLRAAYLDGEYKDVAGTYGAANADVDTNEILGQVNYKVAKNLNTYFRYSEAEIKGTTTKLESNRGRVEVRYSF